MHVIVRSYLADENLLISLRNGRLGVLKSRPVVQSSNLVWVQALLVTAKIGAAPCFRPPNTQLRKPYLTTRQKLGFAVTGVSHMVAHGGVQALLVARTELVLVLDGDMLVHSALHATLATHRDRCACRFTRFIRRGFLRRCGLLGTATCLVKNAEKLKAAYVQLKSCHCW